MMDHFNFVIRDAIADDIPHCLALEHHYESEHVWRMMIQNTLDGYQINFRRERLPRTTSFTHPVDETRLRLALPSEICYLVAVRKDDPLVIGYLTLRPDPIHQIGLIQDIVVAQDFRQLGIGTRLLHVARRWTQDNGSKQLMVEVTTKNYPAIRFAQNQGLQFCGFNDQYFRNQDISVFFGQMLY
ncbi:MAG: GNAT family N-acetyltransferase [Anaerolineae bacterium]